MTGLGSNLKLKVGTGQRGPVIIGNASGLVKSILGISSLGGPYFDSSGFSLVPGEGSEAGGGDAQNSRRFELRLSLPLVAKSSLLNTLSSSG